MPLQIAGYSVIEQSSVVQGSVGSGGGTTDHTQLTNIGTKTHAEIDTFIASKGQANGICPLDANTKVPQPLIQQVISYKDLTDDVKILDTDGNKNITNTLTTTQTAFTDNQQLITKKYVDDTTGAIDSVQTAQNNNLNTLNGKTQNIDFTNTDITKTTIAKKIVAPELSTTNNNDPGPLLYLDNNNEVKKSSSIFNNGKITTDRIEANEFRAKLLTGAGLTDEEKKLTDGILRNGGGIALRVEKGTTGKLKLEGSEYTASLNTTIGQYENSKAGKVLQITDNFGAVGTYLPFTYNGEAGGNNEIPIFDGGTADKKFKRSNLYFDQSLRLSGCATVQTTAVVNKANNTAPDKGIYISTDGNVLLNNYTSTTADGILKLNTDGTIEKSDATLTSNGNLECKSITCNQMYNSDGKGIEIDNATTGVIKMTGDNYSNKTGNYLTLNNNSEIVPLAPSAPNRYVFDLTMGTGTSTAIQAVEFLTKKEAKLEYSIIGNENFGELFLNYTRSNTVNGVVRLKNIQTNTGITYTGTVKTGALELKKTEVIVGNVGGDIIFNFQTEQKDDSSEIVIHAKFPITNLDVNNLPTGWTKIAQSSTQIDLNGNINGSSLNVSGDINFNGNIYKNGTLFSGGGGGGGGSGDVTGPAASDDNTIARFNGTTGKLIQGSGIVINDNNQISGVVGLSTANLYCSKLYSDGLTNKGIEIALPDPQAAVNAGAIIFNGDDYKSPGFLIVGSNGIVGVSDTPIPGISSTDNGSGDIEISFTGSDYTTPGYLKVDNTGKIQVTPSLVVSNAEYDAINTKWLNQRTNINRNVQKIYLPNGVPIGGFDHTIHTCILVGIDPTVGSGTKFYQQTKFVGYIQNGTPLTGISAVDLNSQNVINAYEIYTTASEAHPNNVQNPSEKQHIINHFTSDYNHNYYPNFQVTSVARIAVRTADVGSWDHTKPFFVSYDTTSNQSATITLYGSQNGWTITNAVASYGTIPVGYTEI
jgi:hypothetical protein